MTGIVVVADDLTGAMDTAHRFAERAYDTSVVAVPDAVETALDGASSPVVAVNTDTRYATAATAADVVGRVVARARPRTVYKKVDSTLRGNVGAEVRAALDAADAELALFAPAFPRTGRYTVDGTQHVEGQPVTETEYGDDRNAPSSDRLAELFAGYDGLVERLDGAVIGSGSERVTDALDDLVGRHDRAPIVCCDAATDAELSTIASAGDGYDTVYAGSGGLAAHVEASVASTSPPTAPSVEHGRPLAIVGSASRTTLTQVSRLPDGLVVELDPLATLRDGWKPDASPVTRRLADGQPAVVTAPADDDAVRRTLAAGRERGLSPAEVRGRVADGLAATAAAALESVRPSGLVLTGGDVAVATLRTIGASTVTLSGTAVDAGVPVGAMADGDASGLALVTKAGGFGTERTLEACLDALSSKGDASADGPL